MALLTQLLRVITRQAVTPANVSVATVSPLASAEVTHELYCSNCSRVCISLAVQVSLTLLPSVL